MFKKYLPLILIILFAFVLRVVAIGRFPVGFSADEAVQGYTAYSILKTSHDEWGKLLPLNPRSFGDFKPPLYTYLTIPSLFLFDLNEFAVRLPSAFWGAWAILAVFLLTQELFGKRKMALLAALFLAVCPWHLVFSRAAIEANLTAFFFPMGFYFFLKGLKNPRYFPWAVLFWGLNLYTYHSAKVLTVLFAIFILWWARKKIPWSSKKIKISLILVIIFLSPIIFSLFKGGGGHRFLDVSLFNPTDKWEEVIKKQQEGWLKDLPLFNNKILWVADKFTKNYLSYFSLNFLFTEGSPDDSYANFPGRGLLHLWELPFLLAAVWFFYKRKEKMVLPLLVWLFLAALPAAVSKEPAHANRASTFLPLWSILSAYGGFYLWEFLNKKLSLKQRKIFLVLAWLIFISSLLFFLEDYFTHAPKRLAKGLSYGYRQTIDYLKTVEGDYEKIVMTKRFSEPQVFVAFYQKYNPYQYQKEAQDFLRYEKQGFVFQDQLGVYRLGKFEFRDLNWNADKQLEKTLIVGGQQDFSLDLNLRPQKVIYYPDGKEAFIIVDPKKTP
ncbi:phospholipid carrier-dependent glycosyltransferase [Candidatus Shapirobacteria bacterium]|nr:phospholipid carrier-dependent glycosyltransferase [Candidatus Shapirobacteria bacterium]